MPAILDNASAHIDDLARIAAHAGSSDFEYHPADDQLVCRDIDQAALDDAVRTLPPTPRDTPSWVYPYQARMVLLQHGLLDAVNDIVENAGGATKIAWEYAVEIHRNSPLIEALGTSIGLTSDEIDDLFIEARTY